MNQPLLFDNYPINDQTKREKYKIDPQLESSWKALLKEEFNKPYFAEIKKFLLHAKNKEEHILPPGKMIFSAYNKTPANKVKAIINDRIVTENTRVNVLIIISYILIE